MIRCLALLRGINVGGKNIISMAELRAAMERAGFGDVTTYIQSGNVIFSAPSMVADADVEQVITSTFGLKVAVVLRTQREFERALTNNPFASTDPKHQHIGFAAKPFPPAATELVDAQAFAPDRFAVHGREVYFDITHGMGTSKLVPAVQRKLKVPMTIRNLNTVNKLLSLMDY